MNDLESQLRATAAELGVPASRLYVNSCWLYTPEGKPYLVWVASFAGMLEGMGVSVEEALQMLIKADQDLRKCFSDD